MTTQLNDILQLSWNTWATAIMMVLSIVGLFYVLYRVWDTSDRAIKCVIAYIRARRNNKRLLNQRLSETTSSSTVPSWNFRGEKYAVRFDKLTTPRYQKEACESDPCDSGCNADQLRRELDEAAADQENLRKANGHLGDTVRHLESELGNMTQSCMYYERLSRERYKALNEAEAELKQERQSNQTLMAFNQDSARRLHEYEIIKTIVNETCIAAGVGTIQALGQALADARAYNVMAFAQYTSQAVNELSSLKDAVRRVLAQVGMPDLEQLAKRYHLLVLDGIVSQEKLDTMLKTIADQRKDLDNVQRNLHHKQDVIDDLEDRLDEKDNELDNYEEILDNLVRILDIPCHDNIADTVEFMQENLSKYQKQLLALVGFVKMFGTKASDTTTNAYDVLLQVRQYSARVSNWLDDNNFNQL